MRILLASHTFMGGNFVVGSHHLARAFAAAGHEVLHLATPISPLHAAKFRNADMRRRFGIWWRGGDTVAERLTQMVPMTWVPSKTRQLVGDTNRALTTAVPSLRKTLAKRGFATVDLLLIDQPEFCGIWNYCDAAAVVYRPTDLYAEMTGSDAVVALERTILARSVGSVCTSVEVARHIRSLLPAERASNADAVQVLENGVDFALFNQPQSPRPAEYTNIANPIAVYVGACDERLDIEALTAAAVALRHVTFVVIGPVDTAVATRLTNANIRVLGPRPHKQVPAYLNHATIGLIPMSPHPANLGRSPMKLFEFLAAGLPVVALQTPPLLATNAKHTFLYKSPDDFVPAIQAALAAGVGSDEVREVAKPYDWDARARLLLEMVRKMQLPNTG